MDIADSIRFVPEPTMQVEIPSRKRSRAAAANSDEEDPDHVQTSGRGRRSKAHDSDRQPSSKFKGVCWSKTNKRWQAAIFVHSRNLYLGCYNEELDAAKAYDWVALTTRGADAKINFPLSDYQGADGNMVPNERLNSMVTRHQQNIVSAKKTQLPAISSQSALRTPVTAGQQPQRQHKSTAMAAPSRVQSDAWDLVEQQENDVSLLCGRSASEFMGSGVSEEQQAFAGVLPQAAVGAIGQCSQQQRQPTQMGKLGQQLVLEELQSRMHHIDMSDMASKLPLGAFLQQIVTGPYGMYGLVFGCPQDRTWGAGVWDGMDWHSIGSYGNEADALRACSFVVDVGTSSCPSDGSEADFEDDCVC
eukprot:gene9690-9848_t